MRGYRDFMLLTTSHNHAKISHDCANFFLNLATNISLYLISHHCVKTDPHDKTWKHALMPKLFIFFLPFLKFFIWEIFIVTPWVTEEAQDHIFIFIFIFLFHPHFLISIPCPRLWKHIHHWVLFFFSFFLFEYFLEHSQHFEHSRYSNFRFYLSFQLHDKSKLKIRLRLGFKNAILTYFERLLQFFKFQTNWYPLILCYFPLHMGNQKLKSIEFEEEFVKISDGNGNDIGFESSRGFFLFEPLVSEPLTQRYVTRASLDKGKPKIRVLEKLSVYLHLFQHSPTTSPV